MCEEIDTHLELETRQGLLPGIVTQQKAAGTRSRTNDRLSKGEENMNQRRSIGTHAL